MDKMTAHKFAGLTCKQKRNPKNVAHGVRIQPTVASRDCILHVQAGVRQVYKRAKIREYKN